VRKKEIFFFKWEKEKESEREGELKKNMGEGEGQCVRGRRKNFLVALASINHSATWNGGERGRKQKCPLHSTLKRVKVFIFIFFKRTKKREKEKNQKITFL
jgi:hypothetical protein